MGSTTKYRGIITSLFCLIAVPAFAGSYSAGPGGVELGENTLTVGPSSTSQSEEEQTALQQALCEALARNEDIRHMPDEGVLYDASQDNLNMPSPYVETPLTITEEDIKIPLRIPLMDYLNTPSAYNLNMQEVFIEPGTLNFRDGELYLDDKRLTPDMTALARECKKETEKNTEKE